MSQPAKILIIAAAVFIAPIAIVFATHWEAVEQFVKVDPKTTQGVLIYFTSYG